MNTSQNILGGLENKVRANQPGLLSLFNEAGIPESEVTLRELEKLRKVCLEKYLDACQILYPEYKPEASPIYLFQNGFETTQEKIDRLGIDADFNAKYSADALNLENVTSETVTLSYKHILKWVGYIAIIIATLFALWYFYKKMK